MRSKYHFTTSCILPYSLYFLKFSTPIKNFEFHSRYMKIGLSEVIKLCARKMIKTTHFISQRKMICFRCLDKHLPKKYELQMYPRFMRAWFKSPCKLHY